MLTTRSFEWLKWPNIFRETYRKRCTINTITWIWWKRLCRRVQMGKSLLRPITTTIPRAICLKRNGAKIIPVSIRASNRDTIRGETWLRLTLTLPHTGIGSFISTPTNTISFRFFPYDNTGIIEVPIEMGAGILV